ncbi:integrase core domain-containing protein [Streptomyces violaceusniger]
MHAQCERVIETLRREVLDHLLIWNETHARQILDAYVHHYNRHRPHQARAQLPPLTHEHPKPMSAPTAHRLLHTPNTRRRDQRVQIPCLTSSDEFPNGTAIYASSSVSTRNTKTHTGRTDPSDNGAPDRLTEAGPATATA